MLDFHAERSGRQIGISYVGNVAVATRYATSSVTGYFGDTIGWRQVSEAITKKGSIAGVQLACKTLHTQPPVKWINSETTRYIEQARQHITSLTRVEIGSIIDAFVDSARVAAECGFSVIQIHAAHGYFLSQMCNPEINGRTDEFGKNMGYALRLITERIRGLRYNIVLDVRISLTHGVKEAGDEIAHTEMLIEDLSRLPIDIISVSNGMYEVNRFDIYPPVERGLACYLPAVAKIAARYPGFLFNVAGNIWELRSIIQGCPANVSFAIGRSLIADPGFVEKQLSGRTDDVAACVRSGYCHYATRGRQHIECKVNQSICDTPDAFDFISE